MKIKGNYVPVSNYTPVDLDRKGSYNKIDPMVRPVVRVLHEKGFETYSSCQGHENVFMKFQANKNEKWKSKRIVVGPSISYKSTPALDRHLRKAGFKIRKHRFEKGHDTTAFLPRINKAGKPILPMNVKKRLWKNALNEVKKLRSIK
jgi:hypothetical protein